MKIKQCLARIDLLKKYRDDVHQSLVMEAQQKLGIMLKQQSDFWKQRSKLFWLFEGDVNSKFFHLLASARKGKNALNSLTDDLGNVCY